MPGHVGFQARILSAAGRALLDVGEAGFERVAHRQTTGCFSPLRLDGIGVTLVVDGEPFVPSAQAPLLTSLGLEWLPEVLVIGHELRGEQLERGVLASTVDRRARAIRVRRSGSFALLLRGTMYLRPMRSLITPSLTTSSQRSSSRMTSH